MKVKVDLDWGLYEHPVYGPHWRCEALDCIFIAFLSPDTDGWRLICHNKSIPGSMAPIGEDGNLRKTFEKAPVWATKEDCFAAVRKLITTQVAKARKR